MSKALELGLIGTAPRRRRRWRWPFLFLLTLPTLLVVLVVFGIPLAYSLNLSLHRINMLTRREVWVGLQNYTEILPHPDFLWALARTAWFAIVTVLGGLVLGMAMALVLNAAFPGRNVLRSIVLIPWAMSPVAVGILWAGSSTAPTGP
jgi:multiple sugar transport system permease protein